MPTNEVLLKKYGTLIYLSSVCFSNYSYIVSSTAYVYYERVNWFYYSLHVNWTTCLVIVTSSTQSDTHSLNLNQSKSTDYQWNLTDSNS